MASTHLTSPEQLRRLLFNRYNHQQTCIGHALSLRRRCQGIIPEYDRRYCRSLCNDGDIDYVQAMLDELLEAGLCARHKKQAARISNILDTCDGVYDADAKPSIADRRFFEEEEVGERDSLDLWGFQVKQEADSQSYYSAMSCPPVVTAAIDLPEEQVVPLPHLTMQTNKSTSVLHSNDIPSAASMGSNACLSPQLQVSSNNTGSAITPLAHYSTTGAAGRRLVQAAASASGTLPRDGNKGRLDTERWTGRRKILGVVGILICGGFLILHC
ncbi:hypothetical protein BT63DRAFT_427647 [Microthyrium microscopicum]|uniref:Uncharacterized protein n=1 Tax=Microthyrium microscopicum TaxID=703497 RepID=A0A6A6U8M5_9PEZI|nr:hypothetical protein BT63DRAFT_427647 [Microthyrium microscopicum]